jgi:hypothetical protein
MYRSGPARCRPRHWVWLLLWMRGPPACRELFRCQIAEARVRTHGVVVDAPGIDDAARFGERREHMLVQTLVAKLAPASCSFKIPMICSSKNGSCASSISSRSTQLSAGGNSGEQVIRDAQCRVEPKHSLSKNLPQPLSDVLCLKASLRVTGRRCFFSRSANASSASS